MTINCEHNDGKRCAAGHFGGNCNPAIARQCRSRAPVDAAAPAFTLPILSPRVTTAALPQGFSYAALWDELHRRPWHRLDDPQAERRWWLEDFAPRVPNHGCACSSDTRAWIETLTDDDFADPERLFTRGWEFHERKNHELGKQGLQFAEAWTRYSPVSRPAPSLAG